MVPLAQKKSEILCLKKGKINVSRDNEDSENALDTNNVDLTSVKKILIECCSKQAKRILDEHCRTYIDESKFMSNCGVKPVQDLTLDITLNEKDLECLREMKTNTGIGASINCYCKGQHATAAVYFRGKSNWMDMIKSAENHPRAVDDLQKCWTLWNFKRHLISHKKYYTADRTEDNALTIDKTQKTALNTSVERSVQECFEQLVNDETSNEYEKATGKCLVCIAF